MTKSSLPKFGTGEVTHAALNIDGPTYAHEILATQELLTAFEATAVAA
jgi:hypothetical protein